MKPSAKGKDRTMIGNYGRGDVHRGDPHFELDESADLRAEDDAAQRTLEPTDLYEDERPSDDDADRWGEL